MITLKHAKKYEASREGFIFNKKTGRVLKGVPNTKDQRLRVYVHNKSGKTNYQSVHRLVFEAYNPELELEGWVIHHKDGNYLNNSVSNLERRSVGKHSSDHIRERLSKGERTNRKLTDDIVLCICEDLLQGVSYSNITNKYGCSKTTISYIKNKRQWTHITSNYNF